MTVALCLDPSCARAGGQKAQGSHAAVLERQRWADAPMNDGSFIRWGADDEACIGFVGTLSSEPKCNSPADLIIGTFDQDLRECCHLGLSLDSRA
jgi:hypothetical protein